jgi:hypothetical protein
MTDASSPPADMTHNLGAHAVGWIRANGARAAAEIGANFVLPLLVYSLAKGRLGDAGALMASSAPPLVWTAVEFARRRRIDALSLLVLTGIALSLLAFLGGGGVRFLQLREQLVTALVGLIFLGSATIRRPLIYHLARARIGRASASELEAFEAIQGSDIFRRTMTLATLVWGFGLVAEAALACALVFALSIPRFLIVSPILGTGATVVLTAWTFWYARRTLGPLRRAAQARSDAEQV